jgi:putative two-component system response regulator
MTDFMEQNGGITGGHLWRARCYIEILLDELHRTGLYRAEIDSWDREYFLNSCRFHDLGKLLVKESILYKPGKLTEDEYAEMKTHTLSGIAIIEEMEKNNKADVFLAYAKICIGTHHERWDGTGYPFGLRGNDIPLQGRMMAIADVYDALISERPYKRAYSHEDAVGIIAGGRGTHFDPVLTDLFLDCHGRFFETLNLSPSFT